MTWLMFLSLPFLLLFLVFFLHNKRTRYVESIDLVPNCLLTKHPIVFIHGKKTLFYFGDYWSFIPYYLSEHGYEVSEIKLPWRHAKQRLDQLAEKLRSFKNSPHCRPMHFIADITAYGELAWIKANHPELAQSLWVVHGDALDLEKSIEKTTEKTLANGANNVAGLFKSDPLPIRTLHEPLPNKSESKPIPPLSLILHKLMLAEPINTPLLESLNFTPLQKVGSQYLQWAHELAEKEHLGHI